MQRIDLGYARYWLRTEPGYQYRRYSEKFWLWLARKVIHTELAKWIVVTAVVRAMGDDKSPDQVNGVEVLKAIDLVKPIEVKK